MGELMLEAFTIMSSAFPNKGSVRAWHSAMQEQEILLFVSGT